MNPNPDPGVLDAVTVLLETGQGPVSLFDADDLARVVDAVQHQVKLQIEDPSPEDCHAFFMKRVRQRLGTA